MGGKALNGKTITQIEAQFLADRIILKNDLGSKVERILLCGSARRGKPTCGDLDFVFIDRNDQLKTWLTQAFGFKKNGKPQTTGLIEGVQVEFYEATPETWGSQTLMWTGSASNNIRMRRIANKAGYKMSQYGVICKLLNKNMTAHMSEEEIFKFLGMKYIPPERR